MIYIKAFGHSPDPNDNHIQVGDTTCIIPSDGVTDTFISCETGDLGSDVDKINNPVSLFSYNRKASATTSTPFVISYRKDSTPQLRDVFPSAGFAGNSVNFYGVHKITDLGDGLRNMGQITRIRIGEDMCSRFDVEQENINKDSLAYIRCIQSSTQEAGKYNVSEQVLVGFANNSYYMRRSSLTPH